MRTAVVACLLALGTGACSDDGLAPPEQAAEAGGTTGAGESATSSVNTSATVTATATEGDDEGPKLDVPPIDPGGSSGTGGFEDSGADTEDLEGTTSGGPAEPECVMTEECACDPGLVICEALPPDCPPDMVPLIDETGDCWEGSCVPIESCFTVLDCQWCDEDEACVSAVDLAGPHYTCQPIDPACPDGLPTCECMPMACEGPFFECVPVVPGAEEDLTCVCPTC